MEEATPDTPTATTRRDFLRRASREAARDAVEIGSKVVPGAALAKRFLENKTAEPAPDAETDTPTDTPEDAPPAAPKPLFDPLGWIAAWRKGRD